MDSVSKTSGLRSFLNRRGVGALFAGAFFLRLGVGLGLYLLAYRHDASQAAEVLNRWLLAPDATGYHHVAVALSKVWQGLEPVLISDMPNSFLGYPVLLAGIYSLFGPYYVCGIILNSSAFLAMGLIARRLALLLGQGKTPALCLSLLVCLWPPSLAYSSVLLKDSLFLLSVFGMLYFLIYMLKQGGLSLVGGVLPALGLAASCLLLANIRPEFILVGLTFGGAGVSTAVVVEVLKRRFASLWRPALVFALVSAAFLGAKLFPLGDLARPRLRIPSPQMRQGCTTPMADKITSSGGSNKFLIEENSDARQVVSAKGRVIMAGDAGRLQDVVSSILNRLESAIVHRRVEYAQSGGITLTPKAHLIGSGPRTWSYLALRGLANLLVFPCPWQNWPPGKSRKSSIGLGLAVSGQAVLWYALLPGIFTGLFIRIKEKPLPGLVLAWWVLGLGAVLGIIVVNLGTLYRQRDMVLLPMILFFSAWPYAWLAGLLKPGKKVGKGGRA